MTIFIGMVSQKGGVGKSTLSRLIAREYAANSWEVKIADMDISQSTSYKWQSRRFEGNHEPAIAVERFGSVEHALKASSPYDMMIFDGAPHATAATMRIAEVSQLVVIPTGLALDDLEPSVILAHELRQKGIDGEKIRFALCRVGDSEAELEEAKSYISQAGYKVLSGYMPEKLAYRRASDGGQAATETRFPSLNGKAENLAQSIIDVLSETLKEVEVA